MCVFDRRLIGPEQIPAARFCNFKEGSDYKVQIQIKTGSEIFDNQLAQMKQASKDELNKAGKIANIFRFICPSFYIPGKQDWGTF